MKLVIAVTGASGIIYAENFLKATKKHDIETHLIITESAKKVAKHENIKIERFESFTKYHYPPNDLEAPISSGSYKIDAMVIIPCSMKTVGALAHGYAENLVTRAADVQLKEKRRLIIVPRETPLHAIHLENMAKLSQNGVVILPAMPGFYHNPKTIEELADFISGKILDQLKIQNNQFTRWS
jgi:4-hydroxy-3-polyprenylbenzoate decarboxylase